MFSPIIIESSSLVSFLNNYGYGYLSLFIFPFILFPSNEDLTRIFKKKFDCAPDLIIYKKTAIEKHTIRFQQNLELFYVGYVFLFLLEFIVNFWKYFDYKLAVENIRFEKEITLNYTTEYLRTRERYSWRKIRIFPDLNIEEECNMAFDNQDELDSSSDSSGSIGEQSPDIVVIDASQPKLEDAEVETVEPEVKVVEEEPKVEVEEEPKVEVEKEPKQKDKPEPEPEVEVKEEHVERESISDSYKKEIEID